MPNKPELQDYESVTRSIASSGLESQDTENEWQRFQRVDRSAGSIDSGVEVAAHQPAISADAKPHDKLGSGTIKRVEPGKEGSIRRRGHAVSYTGFILFTVVLYFRPYELFPSLSWMSKSAFWIGLATIVVFVLIQVSLEGRLTVRPREVNFVLLFMLTAILSIPLAIAPGEAWDAFSSVFIKAVAMFIVMVNVVRTERRLKALLLLALAVSLVLSVAAVNDYRLGNLTVEGYRATGFIGNLFGNPNDMALHLVTMVPLAVALLLATRSLFAKVSYAACVVLTVMGTAVTYSRGGFLGLAAAIGVLAWKLGRRQRTAVIIGLFLLASALVLISPSGYGGRISSILNTSDPNSSAGTRFALLTRSVFIAVRHPLLGIGMDNSHIVSIHEQVTHNAYTQVAGEMGLAALFFYVMFMVTPIKGLGRVERDTVERKRASQFYYLAVGLQASIIGYMVSSFFASVAYQWYLYYLVGYAVVARSLYEASGDASSEYLASASSVTSREVTPARRNSNRVTAQSEQ